MSAVWLSNASNTVANQGSVVAVNVQYPNVATPAFDRVYHNIPGYETSRGAGEHLTIGVTLTTINPGASGPVAIWGSHPSKVLCTNAIAIGDYLFPSTSTAFKATGQVKASGVPPHCIGIATSADASDPYQVSALLMPIRGGIPSIRDLSTFKRAYTQPGIGLWDDVANKLYIGQLNPTTITGAETIDYFDTANSGAFLPSTIDHSLYAVWFDEFTGNVFDPRWAKSVVGTGDVTLIAGTTTYIGGIIRVQASANAGDYTMHYDGKNAVGAFATTGIIFDCEAWLGNNDATKENYFGFADDTSLTNCVMMGWNSADHATNFVAKWQNAGGGWNTQNLGVASDASRHRYRVTVAPGSIATFSLDGATSGNGYYSATTNVPSSALMSAMVWAKFMTGASGAVNIYVDYILMCQGR